MHALVREYLPHAPNLGLHLAPDIPHAKLAGALADYAPGVAAEDVLALYDATRLGSAKDGALFLADRFVFQNHNLQTPQAVRYADLVRVEARRSLLAGQKVEIDVNQGRATVTETLDFSGQPKAAEFVERFLKEAMLRGGLRETPPAAEAPATARTTAGSDVAAVVLALDRLKAQGALNAADHLRLVDLLRKL